MRATAPTVTPTITPVDDDDEDGIYDGFGPIQYCIIVKHSL
jgi:hypothetical protein